jgi:hypothetical protein
MVNSDPRGRRELSDGAALRIRTMRQEIATRQATTPSIDSRRRPGADTARIIVAVDALKRPFTRP